MLCNANLEVNTLPGVGETEKTTSTEYSAGGKVNLISTYF